ncbi:aldehyde dehydrogenase [Kiloniella litopenaei]|uniref:Aldehyde dehydrogenase n=1 Tax=Kiloniella litopenaei TaxID=1549748 RepID=A0A0M2R525_9PROT|nr:aldehyde dehydrogenase family protein [Kiloniella litopenaei]KKJ76761.1 aldehyde dehydrogenase [Kiloniella litopenaei]
MAKTIDALISEYFQTGTLQDLPNKLFINGEWVSASTTKTIESKDPGNGKVFASVSAGQAEDIDKAVKAARDAFINVWRDMKPSKRGHILSKAAEILEQKADYFAVVEALDSGKPLDEAKGDVASSVGALRYYAGCADKIQGDTFPLGDGVFSFSSVDPVGVTAHIIPWNYPLATTLRGVAPALAAGCTAVVKPAEQTSLTALMLADVFVEAGLPDGVYNVITGTGAEAGSPLVNHPEVQHITFTGSVGTGTLVMDAAAKNINSVTLELGGKSPIVALADCDLEKTAEGVLWAIFYNAGQICSAGSRLVVERTIHRELVDRIVEKTSQLKAGHALTNPNYGAINSIEQLEKIDGFVERAKARGITVACGGERIKTKETENGWFYAPTIMDDVPMDDELVQQEIFGPVLTVQVVDSLEEAIKAANCTDFALAAGVYTQNISHALKLSKSIDSGQVTVNDYWAGGIEVPFGGNRSSGIGREKGLEALRNYVTTKAITMTF